MTDIGVTRTRRIPLDELASLPTFTYVMSSWSRDKIAFYWDKTGRFELYIMDLVTRELRRLTDGEAPRHLRAGFVWTRDDRAIIFAKDRDGDEQHNLHLIDVRTRAVTQLNDDPKSQEYPVHMAPDNRRLAVLSNRAGQLNLFIFDLGSREWSQVTDLKNPVFGARWSPGGEWLSLNANESPDLRNRDGYLVRPDGSGLRKVVSVREGSEDDIIDWHPDGRRLAINSDADGTYRSGIFDLQTGEMRWLGVPGVEEYVGRFSRTGRWLAAVRNQDSTMTPVLYDVDAGRERLLRLPPGIAEASRLVLGDTRALVTHGASDRRAELLLYDLATDQYETLVAGGVRIHRSLGVRDRRLRLVCVTGRTAGACLALQAARRQAGRGTAGPRACPRRTDQPVHARLRSLRAVPGRPRHRGAAAQHPRLDRLRRRVARPEQEGLGRGRPRGRGRRRGLSQDPALRRSRPRRHLWGLVWRLHVLHGGHEEAGGLQGRRAVGGDQRPPSHDQESMEHFKYFMRHQMGDPVADAALWRDRSAVTHASHVRAKLLIVHGVNDPRCPVSQSRVFRDRLLALGKREGTGPDDDFEYHEFADEGHGPSGDIQGKIRMFKLLADFVERRL